MAKQQLNKNTHARMVARILAVNELRAAKNAGRRAAASQAAFLVGVQQLAAQYGVDPRQLLAVQARDARANSATVAPSREAVHVGGDALRPCKAVHALCATIPDATRGEMIQLCIDNGINRATAATQVGKYRADAAKAAAELAATPAPATQE